MTSGKFQSVPLSQIVVNRDARQRRELVGIKELADSIAAIGLIQPIVIDREYNLIAGERRYTAVASLGHTHITAQFTDELPADELYLIELEENVKRVDLAWQDNVNAVARYHELRAARDPEWNQTKTSRALGISPAEASAKMQVAKALAEGDPLVAKAEKYSVARGIVERKLARSRADELQVLKAKSATTSSPAQVTVELDDADNLESLSAPSHPFLLADFAEWAEDYSGPRFNFIHCDFPYGVNADKHNQGAASAFGGYADGADVYWSLLNTLAASMRNVVAESAHLMFWFSMDYYHETKQLLESMGWAVNPFPLIWHKSDNSGILPDPKRGPRRIYETAFICSRGDRMIVQSVSNVASFPNIKSIHMSEKNPEMLAHFFRMFIDETTIMLDPTMGSGQAVRVAESMGAAHFVGLERDETFFENAVAAYAEAAKEA